MTSQPAADQPTPTDETPDPTAEARSLLAAANRRLLGETIAVEDDAWHQPSLVPGWTRAHVATHIARHAEAIGRLANWARTGVEQQMYLEDRDAAIEAGAARGGLEIQTDLDVAIGQLAQEFDAVAEAGAWDEVVRLRDGQQLPAAELPTGRLFEVTVHHLDLNVGLTVDDIDLRAAELALDWAAFRIGPRSEYPRLRLTTGSGRTYDVGPQRAAEVIEVSGPANRLLGWITRRSDAEGLRGDIPQLPSFG